MKSITINTGAFVFWTVPFFVCTAVAVFLQQLWLCFLPPALLFLLLVFKKPLLLFYCLLLVIPWSFEYNFSASLATDLPDEPLMLLTSFAVIVYAVYNGKELDGKKFGHPLVLLLLLQFFWIVVTVICSTNQLLSVKYLLAKSWYLLSFAAAPVLFFNTKKDITTTALVIGGSMLLLVCTVMIRHAATGFTFGTINENLLPFFRNHVTYSSLLVCITPLLITFYISTKSSYLKGAILVLFIIILAALYLSYARGAWLAFIVGLGVYWLLVKGWLMKAFYGVIIICLISFIWLKNNDQYLRFAPHYKTTIFHKDFKEHMIATYEFKDVSTAERFYRWVAGIRMVGYKPVTGFGPTTFYENYRGYTVPAFKTWVSNNEDHSTVHNYFLLILIEQGIPGLLFFLFIIGYAFYRAQHIYQYATDPFWKKTAAALAVILTMICTVNFLSDLIETDKIGSVFYLCLGVLIFADRQIKNSQLTTNIQRIP